MSTSQGSFGRLDHRNAKGQLDLFDRNVVQEPIKRLPMPRKQLENAVLGVTSLYDLATLRGLSDSRLLELWERFK